MFILDQMWVVPTLWRKPFILTRQTIRSLRILEFNFPLLDKFRHIFLHLPTYTRFQITFLDFHFLMSSLKNFRFRFHRRYPPLKFLLQFLNFSLPVQSTSDVVLRRFFQVSRLTLACESTDAQEKVNLFILLVLVDRIPQSSSGVFGNQCVYLYHIPQLVELYPVPEIY